MFRAIAGQKWLSTGVRRYTSNGGTAPRPFSEVPSPRGALPLLGHTLRVGKKNAFSREIKKMFDETSSPILKLKIPDSSVVLIRDPEALKQVYSAEGQYPERFDNKNIAWFYNQRNEDLAMTFASGQKWREERSQLGKQLLPANVYGYVPGFSKVTDRLMRNIEHRQDSQGYVRDVEELVIYWGLEVGAWFSLGAELDAMYEHHDDAMKLKQAMREFVSAIVTFSLGFPYYKYIPTKFLKRTNQSMDTLSEMTTKYANQHLERIMEGVKKGEKQYGQSLLEQWLIEGKQSKEKAVQNAISMMGAGMDTTINIVSFMLYELSKHPEVQEQLYQQVVSVLGTTGEPDMTSLQKMPYLINIIKESQRISSVVPSHSRLLPKDSTILGYNIPAGTSVLYSMYTANNDPNIYKDPELFNPNRWRDDDINPYAFVPFGLGPRTCWGRRFAEIEMKVLLVKLSQQFVMESERPKHARLAYEEESLIRPVEEISIKFVPRQSSSNSS